MNAAIRARVRVMHMTDALRSGGTERVAVNLVNLLPRERYAAYLCTTREDGPLAQLIAADVQRLRLNRKHRFDGQAIRSLVAFMHAEQIQIIHAHSSAVFVAALAARFAPHAAVIWHDHFGRCDTEGRPVWLYRLATRRARGVIAVNERLAVWSRHALGVRADRVWYVPNFVCAPDAHASSARDLPGTPGSRIVCVANFRPQKDHFTLLRAMASVVRHVPSAHLLLVGDVGDSEYLGRVQEVISQDRLERHVSILGRRDDVYGILHACDIGVLSSSSEGLPLALIEYGMAGLAAVATDVGQCGEVLEYGRSGVLVPPGAPGCLAEQLVLLLRSPERRAALGESFRHRVRAIYAAGPAIEQITGIYEETLRRLPSHTSQS